MTDGLSAAPRDWWVVPLFELATVERIEAIGAFHLAALRDSL